jgi:ribosome-associated protein
MSYTIYKTDFSSELHFSASRSGGAGGQNVNKVNTKVELRFSIPESSILSNTEKDLLISRLSGKLTSKNELIITADNHRSQLKNKEDAVKRFYSLINWGLRPVKRRIPTKPSKTIKEKRIETKRKHSEKKNRRRWNF